MGVLIHDKVCEDYIFPSLKKLIEIKDELFSDARKLLTADFRASLIFQSEFEDDV